MFGLVAAVHENNSGRDAYCFDAAREVRVVIGIEGVRNCVVFVISHKLLIMVQTASDRSEGFDGVVGGAGEVAA